MRSSKFFKLLQSLYLLLLGVGVGSIITCVLSASVVFKAGEILDSNLIGIQESGVLMGLIFQKVNYMFLIMAVMIVVFELLAMRVFRTSSMISTLSSGISVLMILLFALYYTPFILNAPDTASVEFQSMHFQSELAFKILLVSLCVLFVNRSFKLIK